MSKHGGRSVWFGEYVGQLRKENLRVYIDREATLTDTLEEFDSRYLRHISIWLDEDLGTERVIRLKRESAETLVGLLTSALNQTVEDVEL